MTSTHAMSAKGNWISISKKLGQVKSIFVHLSQSEILETLIATWCVEYLRVRRISGFNTLQVFGLSLLMLGVKAVIIHAGRNNEPKHREVVVSDWSPQVGRMGNRQRVPRHHNW